MEKARVYSLLQELLDADQPVAFIGAFKRMAELKAYSVVQGKIEFEEAYLWTVLADALDRVERTLRNDPQNKPPPMALP
jgi:hypothetical protein